MKTNTKTTLILITLFGIGVAFANAEDVKVNWDKNCASCHGKTGKGDTTMGRKAGAKDYTDPKVQESFDDTKATTCIKDGVTENGKEKMKPFKDKLTDEEIKALVAHIRTFKKQ